VTIKETDPTVSTSDAEPVTQAAPDLFIYQTPEPDPATEADLESEAEADEDLEVDSEADEDAEVEALVDDDVDPYETESEAVEVESEVTTDGRPQDNGEDPEALDLQDDTEVLEVEAPAVGTIEGRPFLSDGGVFEERWNAVQIGFVDDPRSAVESADHLVTEAIDDLAKILAGHRELLQAQWHQDDDVDTEQLRVVFRDYRALLLGMLHT